jgi:hypothetical protein
MQLDTGALADASDTLSQAGTVVQKAAETKRSKSLLGRAGNAVAALTLGARLLPGARRLVKRNPLLGTLLIVGTIGAVVFIYSKRVRA